MEIRKATTDDYEQLKEIKLKAKAGERIYNKSLKPLRESGKTYLAYLAKDLAAGDRAVFMAIERGRCVGMITGRIYETLPVKAYRRHGHMSNLFVEPEHRKKDIGTALMSELLKWFRDNGIKDVHLGVYVENTAAREMFRKLDFREYSIEMKKQL
jgi:ribosomal protein S18 acetylase RimI-like enzyme